MPALYYASARSGGTAGNTQHHSQHSQHNQHSGKHSKRRDGSGGGKELQRFLRAPLLPIKTMLCKLTLAEIKAIAQESKHTYA